MGTFDGKAVIVTGGAMGIGAGTAVEFARESPYPDPSELFDDMFANPIPLD